jgi:hypothetical protein
MDSQEPAMHANQTIVDKLKDERSKKLKLMPKIPDFLPPDDFPNNA